MIRLLIDLKLHQHYANIRIMLIILTFLLCEVIRLYMFLFNYLALLMPPITSHNI